MEFTFLLGGSTIGVEKAKVVASCKQWVCNIHEQHSVSKQPV